MELWHNDPITCCFGDMPSQYVSKVIKRHSLFWGYIEITQCLVVFLFFQVDI